MIAGSVAWDSGSPRPPCTLRRLPELDPGTIQRVAAVARLCALADGTYPLSEHVRLRLAGRHADSLHVLCTPADGPDVLGYAHLDLSEPAAGPSIEMAVAPSARGQGIGRLLLLAAAPAGEPVSLWAHGGGSNAARLAASAGFLPVRTLWRMTRPLAGPASPQLPHPDLPDGVTLRAFLPGADEAAWLELNREAFTDLPDQQAWTGADLAARIAQPWFDPAGFLLAHDRDGVLVGFHWTKVHVAGDEHPEAAIGEVYVVGVAPAARGRGLGRALTLAGLHHLRGQGLGQAMLYVDSANGAAISLYLSLGFAFKDAHTRYHRPAAPPVAGTPGSGSVRQ